jgi:dihydrolipoamide dehydrogenase
LKEEFELLIIGAGPGGYVAAFRARRLGLKTAVVEKDVQPGGTCLNRGCIPTKALLHAADLITEVNEASRLGVKVEKAEIDLERLRKRKLEMVKLLTGGVREHFNNLGVVYLQGAARVVEPGVVAVLSATGESFYAAKKIILASGSAVRALPGIDFDGEMIISSDDALELKKIPKSLGVIGAGAVGLEFASIFARFGAKTTVLEVLPRLLPLGDEEISEEIARDFKRQRINCFSGARVAGVEKAAGEIEIKFIQADGKENLLTVEQLLVAAGRKPVTENLGLENTKIKLERGFVEVDEFMRTGEPDIYAVGDIVISSALAHVASAEGILAVEHLAGLNPKPLDYMAIPSCVYTYPEVAAVGLTEAQAKEQGVKIKIGKFDFTHNGKAAILNQRRGFVKIVADEVSGKILGMHIIGPRATEMIGEGALAIRQGLTVVDLAKTVHAHPTVYESIFEAAAMAAGMPIHG